MVKRKTPKEVIESESPDIERAYMKSPRGTLINVTKKGYQKMMKSEFVI